MAGIYSAHDAIIGVQGALGGRGGGVARSTLLDGLVSYWPLNELAGGRADAVGTNHLIDTNGTLSAAGKAGRAGLFAAASGQRLVINDNAGLSFTGAFTISAWVYISDKTADRGVVTKYNTTGAQRSYHIVYETASDRFVFRVSADGSTSAVATANTLGSPATSTWYHLLAYHDPDTDTIGISINNGAADTTAHATNVYDGSAAFQIGGQDGATTFFSGLIDEVAVWNRLLTAPEKAELYNSGNSLAYPFTGVAASLTGFAIRDYTSTAARVPHQRQAFYAAGLYWVFFRTYTFSGSGHPLMFSTSADGISWSTPTALTTTPIFDAQWNVVWDGTYVHVAKNIQTGAVVHDGLSYRRGTPETDGTITWDADWQTAIATGSNVGDFSMCVATDGAVFVGYGSASVNGNALVTKNSASDGTWSTAASFPVALTSSNDTRFAIVTPLDTAGVYVATYKWAADIPSVGYFSSDGSASFSSDGDITTGNVEASSGTGAQVGRIEVASENDGVVHLAYQTSAQKIMYRQRSALGVWGSEVELSDSSRVLDVVSSPRICFDGSGDIYILWSTASAIYLCKYTSGSWGTPVAVVTAALEATFEHAMAAELSNAGKLQLCYLTSDYVLKQELIDV